MNTDALNTYEPLGLVCLSTRLTTAYTGEKEDPGYAGLW